MHDKSLTFSAWLLGAILLMPCITMYGQAISPKQQWILKLRPEQYQSTFEAIRSLDPNAKIVPLSFQKRNERIQSQEDLLYVISESDSFQSILAESRFLNKLEYFERDAIGYATGINKTAETDDPVFKNQWYLSNDGTLNIFGIQAKYQADISSSGAWTITKGDSAIIIAILDTGISLAHPEFENRFWKNKKEIPNNNIDDDNNGFVDDIHGWNFIDDTPNVADDNGHGTAIAGTIAANPDNNIAIAGINWKSKLMICKVLERDQSGYYSDWAAGIYYAVKNGANIINMSVAGEEDLKTLSTAIAYAYDHGVLVVCSTGNENSDKPYYPAAYAKTLAVGSTDPDDSRSVSFNGNLNNGSNFGSHIDLVAPGNVIYGLNRTSYGANTLWGGTSMSSAVVTGVASLLLSQNNSLTPGEVKGILVSSADDQVGKQQEDTPGWDKYYGFGRVNSQKALNQVLLEISFPDPDDLILFPNPASGEINISTWLPSTESVTIQIIDLQGKVLSSRIEDLASPLLNETIDLSNFQPSVYIMVIEQQGRKLTKRFVTTGK